MKYYTGIGSRETPADILELMKSIAYMLYFQGWSLRSGGAEGADTAFEYGHRLARWAHKIDYFAGPPYAPNDLEVYLPWRNFLKNRIVDKTSLLNWDFGFLSDFSNDIEEKANEIVNEIHPAPHMLTQGARKLHMRNCYQVLGRDLSTPSSFVVCWTKDGKDIGGTRTAIVLARKYNIPVCNLGIKDNEIWVRALGNANST